MTLLAALSLLAALNTATDPIARPSAEVLPIDTTIIVPAGARLDVHPMGGEIIVRTWNRNEVRVRADLSSRQRIEVTHEGSVVKVQTESSRPGPEIVDYEITVPARMDLSLGGVSVDIDVEGTEGQVDATTVNGDIRVIGGTGRLMLQAVNGDVRVEGARGTVDAGAVNGTVRLRNVRGPIDVETVSGRIVLEGIESNSVVASSVSGRIFYDGTIVNDGRYAFSSHSGSITLGVPAGLNATVTVAQVSGSLSSTFQAVQTSNGDRSRRRTYTIGNGTALIEAETFSGTIRIAQRGEVTP